MTGMLAQPEIPASVVRILKSHAFPAWNYHVLLNDRHASTTYDP